MGYKPVEFTYINRFMKLKCAEDLLRHRIFPNAKEVCEAFGILDFMKQHVLSEIGHQDVDVVVVGDGSTPRLGALVAFLTGCRAHSIDPQLRCKDDIKTWNNWTEILRLDVDARRIEETVQLNERGETTYAHDYTGDCIIVLPHSHVRAETALRYIKYDTTRTWLVANPCCVDLSLCVPPFHQEGNPAMVTPHHTLKLWRPQEIQQHLGIYQPGKKYLKDHTGALRLVC